MILKEFLSTASADDETALAEARAHTVTEYALATSETVTQLLLQAGLYGPIYDESQDAASSARAICLAFMDRVRTNSTFNWSPDNAKGQANRQLVETLITLMPILEPNFQAFKTATEAETARTVNPFAAVTLHEVKLVRGTCPAVPVTQSGGYAVITTTAAAENHNPRLLADNPRTGKKVRINNFRNVATAGSYDALVPPEWRSAQLYVDDAYGVI